MTDIEKQIKETEDEIAKLPLGSVVKKNVKGKDYFYRRVRTGDKYVELAVADEDVEEVRKQIQKRRGLERKLKELNVLAVVGEGIKARDVPKKPAEDELKKFKTNVYVGKLLAKKVKYADSFKRREIISQIKDYVYGKEYERVLIVYGLRRTGKTTLMLQTIADMSGEDFSKAAYISIEQRNSMDELKEDLYRLNDDGYKWVFIDEITAMKSFYGETQIFSDFVQCGTKIILSGTYSLSFYLVKGDTLLGRSTLVYTTFIPYREFERVLGVGGIDEYIAYAGTMSPSGVYYNTIPTLKDGKSEYDEYVDSAIVKNIQTSLENFQGGSELEHSKVIDLYRKGELTSAINRVIEDMNHKFTVDVLTRSFRSNDLSSAAQMLSRRDEGRISIKRSVDITSFNAYLKNLLEILDRHEQKVEITEEHAEQIKEYLMDLELICTIFHRFYSDENGGDGAYEEKRDILVTQPGLRYAQVKAILESLDANVAFRGLDYDVKSIIKDKITGDILGRMMEEIVLLETVHAVPYRGVYKFTYMNRGEIDMVVRDGDFNRLYEIKYSKVVDKNQYKRLNDDEICHAAVGRFDRISGKYVIYRGETTDVDGIHYINVEEYLRSLIY